jgi:hypothetical protein
MLETAVIDREYESTLVILVKEWTNLSVCLRTRVS